MQHNFNKLNLQPEDIVILDKEFRNSSEVKILSMSPNGLFSTIQDPSGKGEPWDTMTNRLTPKE